MVDNARNPKNKLGLLSKDMEGLVWGMAQAGTKVRSVSHLSASHSLCTANVRLL